jgi:hypothetical protein
MRPLTSSDSEAAIKIHAEECADGAFRTRLQECDRCRHVQYAANMENTATQLSELLHQAAETHHVVYAITEGTDADWATWYSDWLVNLSRLSELLGVKPVRSELT